MFFSDSSVSQHEWPRAAKPGMDQLLLHQKRPKTPVRHVLLHDREESHSGGAKRIAHLLLLEVRQRIRHNYRQRVVHVQAGR